MAEINVDIRAIGPDGEIVGNHRQIERISGLPRTTHHANRGADHRLRAFGNARGTVSKAGIVCSLAWDRWLAGVATVGRRGLAGGILLLGQDQLAMAGTPQTVLLSIVLNLQLTPFTEQ